MKNSDINCPFLRHFGWGVSHFYRRDLIKWRLCNLGCSFNEWKFCTNSLFFQTRNIFFGNQSTEVPNPFHSSSINFFKCHNLLPLFSIVFLFLPPIFHPSSNLSKCDGWHIFLGKLFMVTSYWMPPSYFSVHNSGKYEFSTFYIWFHDHFSSLLEWYADICQRKVFCSGKLSKYTSVSFLARSGALYKLVRHCTAGPAAHRFKISLFPIG